MAYSSAGTTSLRRVLLVGDPVEGGLTQSLRRGFQDLGWFADFVPWHSRGPRPYIAAALRLPGFAEPFRRVLRRQVEATTPADLVLVVRGELLDHRTIASLRRAHDAPVVCWNPDSPFDDAISNRGGGIPSVIGSYDRYVTWANDVADQLDGVARGISVIPFGWDPHAFFVETGSVGVSGRIIFVGTWTAEREQWVRSIQSFGPVVFGGGWPGRPPVEVRPPIRGARLRIALGEAAASLNFLRPQNKGSHNMRTFEIVGCGGIQVAQRSADHERLLEPHGMALFDTVGDLVNALQSLSRPVVPRVPDWLGEHTYASRVCMLLRDLEIA